MNPSNLHEFFRSVPGRGVQHYSFDVIKLALDTGANILFFDAGYRGHVPVSAGAWVVFAVFGGEAVALACQGFLLEGRSGSFAAEAVALVSSATFIHNLLNSKLLGCVRILVVVGPTCHCISI